MNYLRQVHVIGILLTSLVWPAARATALPVSESVVVNAINSELNGALSAEDIAKIEAIEAEQQPPMLTEVSLLDDVKRVTFLICASGRAAAVAKGRVGICSTLTGQLYTLLGFGAGASVGLQASVSGVTIVSPPEATTIEGTYGSATSFTHSGLGFMIKRMVAAESWRVEVNAIVRFLTAFGGPDFAIAQSQDSFFMLAGVGVGPMFDIGVEWFKVMELSHAKKSVSGLLSVSDVEGQLR